MFPLYELIRYKLLLWIIIVSGFGGTFHYGYNISVMNAPSKFIKDMMNETLATRYNLTVDQRPISFLWSTTVSIFSLGGIVGSMLVGSLVSWIGRKKTLFLNGFVAIAGALFMIISKFVKSFEMIIIGRLLYGIHAGIALSAQTLYVTECAPQHLKATAGVTAATFTCFGRFCGQIFGIRELLGTEDCWCWLLGFNGFLALVSLISLPNLPESPNFLLLDREDRPACEQALRTLWGDGDHSGVIDKMLEERAALQAVRSRTVLQLLLDRRVREPLMILVVTFISLQLCGVIAVYFYSDEVFRSAGIAEKWFPYAALGMGGTEWLASCTFLLFLVGTNPKIMLLVGYGFMSGIMGFIMITVLVDCCHDWFPFACMAAIYLFIGCCAFGPGAVTGPLPGQLFTHSFKSAAFTLAYFLSWLTSFIVGIGFSHLIEGVGPVCFVIFLGVCVYCWVFVFAKLPMLNGDSLMELNEAFHMQCNVAAPAAAPAENNPDEAGEACAQDNPQEVDEEEDVNENDEAREESQSEEFIEWETWF